MAIASSDRIKMRRGTSAESSWGETPSSPACTDFRVTSANANSGKTTVQSTEIRPDRMVSDIIQTGFSASGDFGTELSYASHDWAMESLFGSTFDTNTITGAGSTQNFRFEPSPYNALYGPGLEAFQVGQWVTIASASNSANNGRFRITGKNTNYLVFDSTQATFVSEDSSSASITGTTLVMGTSEISYFMEQEFNDITQFKYMTGLRISQMDLNVTSRSVITAAFNWMAKDLTRAASTTGGASAAANSNRIIDASTGVGTVEEADATLSTALRSISCTVNGNLRALDKIGASALAEINDGTFNVTGTVEAYFEDAGLYTKALDHTATSLNWRATDAAGNMYIFGLPKVYLTGDPNAAGQNQDILLPLAFEAAIDADSSTMMRIDKLAA